jgi:hypothetical protein
MALCGFAAVAILLPLSASAGPRQKPGLWEISTQSEMKNDRLKAKAAQQQPQMTPEMMAQMQQYGIKMPQINSQGAMTQSMSQKICLTPEQAAKAEHPDFGRSQQCQMTKSSYSGNTFTGEMKCNSPEMQGTGTISMTLDSDAAYHGTMHFSGTSAHGGPMEMNNQISGKWLGADCGDVKSPQQMSADAAARAAAMKQHMEQMKPPTH